MEAKGRVETAKGESPPIHEILKEKTIEGVVAAVARASDIHIEELIGRSKRREISEVRQMAMAIIKLCHKKTSKEAIGKWFGGRHHATVIHSIRTVRGLYAINKSYRMKFQALVKEVNPKAKIKYKITIQ